MPELPVFEKPETLSAEDVMGNCPLVLVTASGYVHLGWLVEVTDTDAYLARILPKERGGSQIDYRWHIRRDTIDSYRVLQEQRPSVQEGQPVPAAVGGAGVRDQDRPGDLQRVP